MIAFLLQRGWLSQTSVVTSLHVMNSCCNIVSCHLQLVQVQINNIHQMRFDDAKKFADRHRLMLDAEKQKVRAKLCAWLYPWLG